MATVFLMGVRASSPYDVKKIEGSKITFVDGGWCDVYNWDIRPREATITLGEIRPEEETYREFGTSFDVDMVTTIGVPKQCLRVTKDRDTKVVSVRVEGPKSLVDQLSVEVVLGVLTLLLRDKARHVVEASCVAVARGSVAVGDGAVAVGAGGVYIGGRRAGTINAGNCVINTGGGAFIAGNVDTRGGDFHGRNFPEKTEVKRQRRAAPIPPFSVEITVPRGTTIEHYWPR